MALEVNCFPPAGDEIRHSQEVLLIEEDFQRGGVCLAETLNPATNLKQDMPQIAQGCTHQYGWSVLTGPLFRQRNMNIQ